MRITTYCLTQRLSISTKKSVLELEKNFFQQKTYATLLGQQIIGIEGGWFDDD